MELCRAGRDQKGSMSSNLRYPYALDREGFTSLRFVLPMRIPRFKLAEPIRVDI